MSMVWVECLAFFGCPGTFRIVWGLVFVFARGARMDTSISILAQGIFANSALRSDLVYGLRS